MTPSRIACRLRENRRLFYSARLLPRPSESASQVAAKVLGRRSGLTANLRGECLGKLDRPLMAPAASSTCGTCQHTRGPVLPGRGPVIEPGPVGQIISVGDHIEGLGRDEQNESR